MLNGEAHDMNTAQENWIGRQRLATDVVTGRLLTEFRATMDGVLCDPQVLPGLHWCLTPEIYPPADLGRDGHPKTGLFLPDLGLPRRMWAGGKIAYNGGFTANDRVTRSTTIRDIQFKEGRSGKLAFVALDHVYECDGEVRVTETHNIVYRDDPSLDAPAPLLPQAKAWIPLRAITVTPTPTLLFRYSAMTFNGHRIHYDPVYAARTEGYDGLVVHGPLQATWMQILATDILGHLPREFTYRGLSPLICGWPAQIEAIENGDGLELRVRDIKANVVTMSAQAR
jgi:3-methylfumaryl-CoA hydratase